MAHKQHAVSQLERHYRRIRGELAQIEEEIVRAGTSGPVLRDRRAPELVPRNEMLAHIAACIGLFDPDWAPVQAPPIKPRKPSDPDKWGRLLNWAYDVLRPAPEPMTSVEILDALWKTGRVTKKQAQDYRARLTTLLRGQERLGAVRSTGARPLHWSIIRAPSRALARTE